MYNQAGEKLEYHFHDAERDDVLVVIGHGLTGHMERPLYRALAEALTESGWPVLRFSFSGHGNSEGQFEEMTLEKEIADLQAVLDQFKGTRKVAYIGHSLGAAVGALTAAKDDRINVLVSLAGIARPKAFYDQEFSDQEAGESVMWDEPTFPLSKAFRDSMQATESVIPAVRELKLTWLLIHGSEDDVVVPQQSEELYQAIKGKTKHLVYAGADHQFSGHEAELCESINDWLNLHF